MSFLKHLIKNAYYKHQHHNNHDYAYRTGSMEISPTLHNFLRKGKKLLYILIAIIVVAFPSPAEVPGQSVSAVPLRPEKSAAHHDTFYCVNTGLQVTFFCIKINSLSPLSCFNLFYLRQQSGIFVTLEFVC